MWTITFERGIAGKNRICVQGNFTKISRILVNFLVIITKKYIYSTLPTVKPNYKHLYILREGRT